MNPWFVYILQCGDRSLYTGISNNVDARIKMHNAGKGAAYTRSHLPVKLVWKEEQESGTVARKREVQIKKMTRLQKQELIKQKIAR